MIPILPSGLRKAPRNPMSSEQYREWLKSLKTGESCIMQTFVVARGSRLQEYQGFDYWQYEHASYWGDRLICGRDTYSLNKEGVLSYWDSEKPYGEGLPSRIIPCLGADLLPADDASRVYDCPVFEPLWEGYRNYFLLLNRVEKVKRLGLIYRALKEAKIPYYTFDVEEGTVFVAFGDKLKVLRQYFPMHDTAGLHLYSKPL